MSLQITISEVNNFGGHQFKRMFGNVVELCSDAAVQVWNKKPFSNASDLCEAFHKYLMDLSFEEKLVVLKLHPDLAGQLAAQGELTRESKDEQRSAGLNNLTMEQKNIIDEYNQRYKQKFGFPFVICARENKIQSIIKGLEVRYLNARDQEVNIGIDEVIKICKLRILDIVKEG